MAGRICRTCGARYIKGETAREHAQVWHWWCKPDTCSRHHRHVHGA